jgi:hypothetical protein
MVRAVSVALVPKTERVLANGRIMQIRDAVCTKSMVVALDRVGGRLTVADRLLIQNHGDSLSRKEHP